MRTLRTFSIFLALSALLVMEYPGAVPPLRAGDSENPLSPEQRAVAYLVQEVPRWSRDNHCFSCHNNGDAARALLVAQSKSIEVPQTALSDTLDWLLHPAAWDEIKGQPGGSDTKLARIQFAAALTEAHRTGTLDRPQVLTAAADSLLPLQAPNGSWSVDAGGVLGSPATYGNLLATYLSRRTLRTAGATRFEAAAARADTWIRAQKPTANVDTAAQALAFSSIAQDTGTGTARDDGLAEQLQQSLERLVAAQGSDGGWGPYPNSPSEAFDTAIAMLALTAASSLDPTGALGWTQVLARGRDYLIEIQLPSGGWPPTTRPSGFESYAQHISTSGWATLALLESRQSPK